MIYGETAGSAKFKPNFKSENVTKLSRGTSIQPKSKAKVKLKDTIKAKSKKSKTEPKVAQTFGSILNPNPKSEPDLTNKPKKSSRLTSITLKIPPVDPKFIAKEYAKIANIDDTPMTDEEAKDIGSYLAKILSSSESKAPSLKLGKLKAKKKGRSKLDFEPEVGSDLIKSKSKSKKKVKESTKAAAVKDKAEMPMPFKKVKTKSDEKKALPLSERLLLIRERLRAKKAKAAEVETVVKPKKSRLATFAGDSDLDSDLVSPNTKAGRKKIKSKQKNIEFETAKAAELKEIEEIKEQLRRKLEAAAFEEGVEMVFDVDAALKPLEDEVLAANPETLKATAAKLNPELDYTKESPLPRTSSKSVVKKKSKITKRKKKPVSYEEVLLNNKAVDYADDNTIVPAPRPRRTFRDDEEYVEITAPDPYESLSPRARLIAERKLGSQHTPGRVKHTGKIDPEALASNVVDIPQSEVESFRAATKKLTRKYIDFMRSDILPHLIALDSAIDYTKALMADGLSREDITTDDSLLITLRWMLHRKATDFFGSVLGCKMDGEAFDQVISQLYKSDLMKATSYITDTVGIVRGDKARIKRSKKTNSLGVVSPKQ